MRRTCIVYFLVVCLLLSLCACKGKGSAASSLGGEVLLSTIDAVTAPENIQQFDLPTENIKASHILSHGVPSTTGPGFYTCSKILRYTDVEMKQSVVMCAQIGCSHSDASCQAWIGWDVGYICEYRGTLYATVMEEDGTLVFLKKDIATGERTVIDSWPLDKDPNREIHLGIFADGKCILTFSRIVEIPLSNKNGYYIDSENQQFLYDLSTSQKQRLPEEYSDWSVAAICNDRLLLTYNGLSQEYKLQAIYGDDYKLYYIPNQMVEYNLATGESKTIATEAEGLLFTADPCVTYGYNVVYQMDNNFCIYDLESGTNRVVVTMENVSNFWILDHKIFLIEMLTKGEISQCFIYYIDMNGGDLVRMENGGNTDYMHFSVTWEGNGFFGGNFRGKCLITKEDFYLEQYENYWLGGY